MTVFGSPFPSLMAPHGSAGLEGQALLGGQVDQLQRQGPGTDFGAAQNRRVEASDFRVSEIPSPVSPVDVGRGAKTYILAVQ